MDNFIISADYVISLATNSVTEEIRENYKSNIVNELTAFNAFELILRTILKSLNQLDSEKIIEIVKKEYINLGLPIYLGDFNNFIDFINFLIKIKQHKVVVLTVEIFKQFILIADKMDERIAYSIYYLTLQQLLSNNLIIKDLEFAQKVNNYVKNSKFSDNKILYEVIHETINRFD